MDETPRHNEECKDSMPEGVSRYLASNPKRQRSEHRESVGRQAQGYEDVPYHQSIKGSYSRLAKACRDRSETSHESSMSCSISAHQLTATTLSTPALRGPAVGRVISYVQPRDSVVPLVLCRSECRQEFRRFMTKSTNAHAVVVSATFVY
jgi:hypothetical protein